MLLRYISQDELFLNKLSLFLRETEFDQQEFFSNKLVLDIKYYYLDFNNNNLFYLFND